MAHIGETSTICLRSARSTFSVIGGNNARERAIWRETGPSGKGSPATTVPCGVGEGDSENILLEGISRAAAQLLHYQTPGRRCPRAQDPLNPWRIVELADEINSARRLNSTVTDIANIVLTEAGGGRRDDHKRFRLAHLSTDVRGEEASATFAPVTMI